MVPLISASALAQKGLNISKAFDGRYSKKSYAEEVSVSGRFLLNEDIQFYRALTVTDADATNFIRELVIKDGATAKLKEVTMRGGKLAYGFYQLPPTERSGCKRFIFFYENKGKGALIYMEGHATLPEIKKAIMNK
jgi:hypothetical protein